MIFVTYLALLWQMLFVQMPFPGWGLVHAVGGGGGCAQATSFLARTSGLDSTHQTNYTTLICGLVTDGVWSKLDALYVFATADTTTAALNLVSSSFNGTTHGSLTFSADHGWTGDASTGYIDTGFNPSTAGGNYVQNGASLSVYIQTNRGSQAYGDIGVQTALGTNNIRILPQFAGNLGWTVNSSLVLSSDTTAQGFWIIDRTGSAAQNAYRNSSSFAMDTTLSGALANLNIYVFAENNQGSAATFTGDQLSEAHIGGSLTSTDEGNISSRINAYMTAYGINVY